MEKENITKTSITIGKIRAHRLSMRALALCLMLMLGLPIISINFNPAVAEDASAPSPSERMLLEAASASLGIPIDNLHVVRVSNARLPLTKVEAIAGKLYRSDTEEIFSIAIDPSGRLIDLPSLRQVEVQHRDARYGKLDPFLYEVARLRKKNDLVKVAFWLNLKVDLDEIDPTPEDGDLKPEEIENLIEQRRAQLVKAAADATRSLRSFLGKKKFQINEVSLIAPIVYATVPVKALPTIGKRADVRRIYYAEDVSEDHLDIAAKAMRADQVWNDLGYSGTGVNVAIIEDSRVDFDNSCLVNNLGTRVEGDDNVDVHATTCAGMVASNHDTVRGIGWGAGIYSANGTTYQDEDMSAALDAGSENTHILNNSWGNNCGSANGTLNIHSRHADFIVRFAHDTVVASAGNNGECTGSRVSGVAAGFNVIAVGNYDDSGTAEHDDDTMHSTSSFGDPLSPNGDREKPEVSAPGTGITSLLTAEAGECTTDLVGFGTSFSAPMVSGVAALMMEAKPILKIRPEAVKALLMASATDNVEGARRLSDKDGAGGVNAMTAVSAAERGQFVWRRVRAKSFGKAGFIEIPLGFAPAGARIKVALAWDSNPSGPADNFDNDTLDADFDLQVIGGATNVMSASQDNSYEVVDFTTAVAGIYKLRIHASRFEGSSERLAVAWNRAFIDPVGPPDLPVRR